MKRRRSGAAGRDLKSKPPEYTFGEWLFYLRDERRKWSLVDLARNMVKVAACYTPSASAKSLKPMISKWEHNHIEPDQYNLHLLATTLGVKVAQLGQWVDPRFVWRPTRPVELAKVLATLHPPMPAPMRQSGQVTTSESDNSDNPDNRVTTR